MSKYRYRSQDASGIGPRRYCGNERGIALIMALMFLVVLALLTVTTSTVTTLASQISGNYKASIQSFQSAEAGVEEARARLRANVAVANSIYDTTDYANPPVLQPTWQTYIGSATDAQVYGYTTGNTQTRVDSLQTASHYTVVITHAVNASGQMLYWGDTTGSGKNTRNTTLTGNPIYLVTSHGTAGGANSIVQTQVARVPPVTVPGAVYVDDLTKLLGTSTYIDGNDACGTHNVPGITTPLGTTTNGQPTITKSGNPVVQGKDAQGNSVPMQYNYSTTLDVQAMVDSLKGVADFSYTYSDPNVTLTTVSNQSWGTPTAGATQNSALSCTVSHTVYFNMNNTSLKLSGGTQGCGFLLVQGNLEINGGFSWYGPVLVTGLVTYSGGGNKNISGALISGGQTTINVNTDDVIGGNATILNCSQAITNAVQNRPLLVLNWTQT